MGWLCQLFMWCLRIGVFIPKAFYPLSGSFLFPISKHVTVRAILLVKKMGSKHMRNGRTVDIVLGPPLSWDITACAVSVRQWTGIGTPVPNPGLRVEGVQRVSSHPLPAPATLDLQISGLDSFYLAVKAVEVCVLGPRCLLSQHIFLLGSINKRKFFSQSRASDQLPQATANRFLSW